MKPIDPRIPPALLPLGTRPIIKGAAQADTYIPLPSVHTPAGKVVTRWQFTADERRRIMLGEDLFLTHLTFNAPLQPVMLTIGVIDWSDDAL